MLHDDHIPDDVYWCRTHHRWHEEGCEECAAEEEAHLELSADIELADCAACGERCEPATTAQGYAPICTVCAARELYAYDEAMEAAE